MTLFLGSEHARAFAPKFIEVASLNAKVSDAILEQIERVRKAAALAPSVGFGDDPDVQRVPPRRLAARFGLARAVAPLTRRRRPPDRPRVGGKSGPD